MALGVQIRQDGGQQVIRTLEQVDRVGRTTARSFGGLLNANRTLSSSMNRTSFVLQDVARDFAVTGSVGTRELKNLARSGTELALMMGAGGPLVAAVGLVALTFATTFTRARKEMEDTRKKAVQEIAALQDAGNLAEIEARARALEIGRPSAGESERVVGAFKGSLRDLRAELASLEAESKKNAFFGLDPDATKRLRFLRAEVPRLTAEIESLRQAALNIGEPTTTRGLAAIEVTADADSVAIKRVREEIDELERQLTSLKDVRPELAPTFNPSEELIRIQEQGIRIPAIIDVEFPGEISSDAANAIEQQAQAIAAGIEGAFTETLSGLFTGDLGDSLLSGLGGLMIRFGEAIIPFGKLLAALSTWLKNNPIGAGFAAVAIGAAMIALGSALRGAAGGGRGGGTSFGGGGIGRPENTSRFTLPSPGTTTSGMASQAAGLTPVQPMQFNFTVVGEHDPKAQRQIVALITNAGLRGLKPA